MENTSTTLDEEFASPEFVPEYATSGKRFLNWIIDRIVLYVIIIILAVVAGALGYIEYLESRWFDYAAYFIIATAYYIILESNGGQTIGKMITRCKVVNVNGEKPTLGSIVKRTFARYIPLEGLSFLGSRLGIHDTISKTQVITNYRVNTI